MMANQTWPDMKRLKPKKSEVAMTPASTERARKGSLSTSQPRYQKTSTPTITPPKIVCTQFRLRNARIADRARSARSTKIVEKMKAQKAKSPSFTVSNPAQSEARSGNDSCQNEVETWISQTPPFRVGRATRVLAAMDCLAWRWAPPRQAPPALKQ